MTSPYDASVNPSECLCTDDGEVLDQRDCPVHDVCDGCDGTGYESWDRHVVCPDCNGVGR